MFDLRLLASRRAAVTFLSVSQHLYCHRVIRSDNSITVDELLPALSPRDNFPGFSWRDGQQGGECLCPPDFSAGPDGSVCLHIGGAGGRWRQFSVLQSVTIKVLPSLSL